MDWIPWDNELTNTSNDNNNSGDGYITVGDQRSWADSMTAENEDGTLPHHGNDPTNDNNSNDGHYSHDGNNSDDDRHQDDEISSRDHNDSDDSWPAPDPYHDHYADTWWDDEDIYRDQAKLGVIAESLAESKVKLRSWEPKFMETRLAMQRGVVRAMTALCVRSLHQKRTIMVDTAELVVELVDRLANMIYDRVQVIIDLEGFHYEDVRPTFDIMELYITPHRKLYLIDVYRLGPAAWDITNASGFSLRKFLTSSEYKKIMWDLRQDAYVLNNGYDLQLAGIIDASLWTLGHHRWGSGGRDNGRKGIVDAIREHLTHRLFEQEIAMIEIAHARRHSEMPYRAWQQRPLPKIMINYAADVRCMGLMYLEMKKFLEAQHADQIIADIEYLTEQDLEIASDPYYEPRGEREPTGPWQNNYVEDWKRILRMNREDAIAKANA